MKSLDSKKKKLLSIGALLLAVVLCAVYFMLIRPELLKLRYPLKYEESILKSAAEFGLDPSLVAAVVCCESSFRPTVVSNAGAVGLMQIMPATGAEIAGWLGFQGYDPEWLNEPELNLRFGCRYLEMLNGRFSGNVVNMLSGYNAGPHKTDEWILEYGVSQDGSVRYIPYPETDQYVDRVLSAQKAYKRLYPELGGTANDGTK